MRFDAEAYAAITGEREQWSAERGRLGKRIAEVEADRNVLAAALAAATHAYVPCGPAPSDSCDHDYAGRDGDVWLCMAKRADPVHDTLDAVRARLAGGAS